MHGNCTIAPPPTRVCGTSDADRAQHFDIIGYWQVDSCATDTDDTDDVIGVICTSGVNLDTAVRFADPDFLLWCKMSAIWRCFTLIFAFNILIVRHISTSGLFDLLT